MVFHFVYKHNKHNNNPLYQNTIAESRPLWNPEFITRFIDKYHHSTYPQCQASTVAQEPQARSPYHHWSKKSSTSMCDWQETLEMWVFFPLLTSSKDAICLLSKIHSTDRFPTTCPSQCSPIHENTSTNETNSFLHFSMILLPVPAQKFWMRWEGWRGRRRRYLHCWRLVSTLSFCNKRLGMMRLSERYGLLGNTNGCWSAVFPVLIQGSFA